MKGRLSALILRIAARHQRLPRKPSPCCEPHYRACHADATAGSHPETYYVNASKRMTFEDLRTLSSEVSTVASKLRNVGTFYLTGLSEL